jgi:(heptosyl)LPS beta-1,4-glucosyltransferase
MTPRAIPLSVCILTLNEEENLPECLQSVREIAGEIVILDSGSTDRTREIAARAGARVEVRPFDDFGSQHNHLFDLAKNEWILNIDADERVSPELSEAIADLFSDPPRLSRYNGFSVNRLNYFIGKPIRHSGWAPDPLLRLFRKNSGEMERRLVHGQILVRGTTGTLSGELVHYTYRSLDSYLQKTARYARLAAVEMKQKGKNPSLVRLLSHPLGMAFKMYVLKRGFLDGREGIFLAILYSYYTFLKYVYLFYL